MRLGTHHTEKTKRMMSKSMKQYHEQKNLLEHLEFLLDHFSKEEILETFAKIDKELQERK